MSMNEETKPVNLNDGEIDLGEDIGDDEVSRTVNNGRYLLKIEDVEKRYREKDSEPYLNIRFRIMDAADEADKAAAGESVFDIFNLSDAAMWKIKSLIKSAMPEYTGSKIPKDLIGKFVSSYVYNHKWEEYENLRTKQYRIANGWRGSNYIIDENGKMEMIGTSKKVADSSKKPQNGDKKSAKPAPKKGSDDEVEV